MNPDEKSGMNFLIKHLLWDTEDTKTVPVVRKPSDRLRKYKAAIERETPEERKIRLERVDEVIRDNCNFEQLMVSSGIDSSSISWSRLGDSDPLDSTSSSTMFIRSHVPGIPVFMTAFDDDSDDSTTVDSKDLKTLLDSEKLYSTVKAIKHQVNVKCFHEPLNEHGDTHLSRSNIKEDSNHVGGFLEQDLNERIPSDSGKGDYYPIAGIPDALSDSEEDITNAELRREASMKQLVSAFKKAVAEKNFPKEVLENLVAEKCTEYVEENPEISYLKLYKTLAVPLLEICKDGEEEASEEDQWDPISPSPLPSVESEAETKEGPDSPMEKPTNPESSDEVPERAPSQVTIDGTKPLDVEIVDTKSLKEYLDQLDPRQKDIVLGAFCEPESDESASTDEEADSSVSQEVELSHELVELSSDEEQPSYFSTRAGNKPKTTESFSIKITSPGSVQEKVNMTTSSSIIADEILLEREMQKEEEDIVGQPENQEQALVIQSGHESEVETADMEISEGTKYQCAEHPGDVSDGFMESGDHQQQVLDQAEYVDDIREDDAEPEPEEVHDPEAESLQVENAEEILEFEAPKCDKPFGFYAIGQTELQDIEPEDQIGAGEGQFLVEDQEPVDTTMVAYEETEIAEEPPAVVQKPKELKALKEVSKPQPKPTRADSPKKKVKPPVKPLTKPLKSTKVLPKLPQTTKPVKTLQQDLKPGPAKLPRMSKTTKSADSIPPKITPKPLVRTTLSKSVSHLAKPMATTKPLPPKLVKPVTPTKPSPGVLKRVPLGGSTKLPVKPTKPALGAKTTESGPSKVPRPAVVNKVPGAAKPVVTTKAKVLPVSKKSEPVGDAKKIRTSTPGSPTKKALPARVPLSIRKTLTTATPADGKSMIPRLNSGLKPDVASAAKVRKPAGTAKPGAKLSGGTKAAVK